MVLLDDWRFVSEFGIFRTPKLHETRLMGYAHGHPKLGFGEVRTSPVCKMFWQEAHKVVETRSGTLYKLGMVHKGYQKWIVGQNSEWTVELFGSIEEVKKTPEDLDGTIIRPCERLIRMKSIAR